MSSDDLTTGWHPPTPEGLSAPGSVGGAGSTGGPQDEGAPPSTTSTSSPAADQHTGPWVAGPADQPSQAHAPAALPEPPAGYAEAARYMLGTPRPGIIPLRPLGIGEILGGAVEALRASPKAMFLPSLAVMTAVGILSTALTLLADTSLDTHLLDFETEVTSTPEDEDPLDTTLRSSLTGALVALPTSVLTFFAATILSGLLIVAVSYAVLGQAVTPGQAWARTRRRIWALVGQSLLSTAIIMVTGLAALSLVALLVYLLVTSLDGAGVAVVVAATLAGAAVALASLVLMVILTVRLSLAPAVLVLESTRVAESLRRSWALTRGSTWRVLGILLLAQLILSAVVSTIQLALGLSLGIIAALLSSPTFLFLAGLVFAPVLEGALTLPFSAAVTALTYTDLRMRTEGLDVELRRSARA